MTPPGYWEQEALIAEAENERLRLALAKIADKAKYLGEPAWNLEGCALVGKQIHRWAADAVAGKQAGE